MRNLESLIKDEWKIPPRDVPDEVPYKSQLVFMPVKAVIDMLGFNYREHSIKETNNISDSIEHVGLLEPHVVTYDTKNDIWTFCDGEGRLWSCYQNGADEVPVDIFYDVSPDVALQMQVALNSTKMKIDSEDIAHYTKGLALKIAENNHLSAGKIGDIDDYLPSVSELAGILSRSKSTVRNYLVYNELHKDVRDYVNTHREKNLFWRSVIIGRKFPNKRHQREFLYLIVREEEKNAKMEKSRKRDAERQNTKYSMKPARLSDSRFHELLKKYVEHVKEKDDGQIHLKHVKSNHKNGDLTLKDIYEKTRMTKKYIDSYTNLIEVYPEIKRDSMDRIRQHVQLLKDKYERLTDMLTGETKNILVSYLQKPPEKKFREKILEQAELRRKKTDDGLVKRIKTIGDKIVYIPLNEIELAPSQLRTRYTPESISELAEKIRVMGQIKPGLIKKLDTPKGDIKYTLTYGHRRFKAVTLLGKQYYKTFIRDDLTDVEVALLQSVEDLSESDTPMERAKVYNKQFNLKKLQAEKEQRDYTRKDFVSELKHVDPKILRDALEFMELDEHIRNMVSMKIISYESALKIGKLSEDDRLTVLYQVMTSQIKGSDLETYIRKVQENSGHQTLFNDMEMPKSYSRILEQFEKESMRPFNYINHYMNIHSDSNVFAKITRPTVMIQYAEIYKSILRLERNLDRNGNSGNNIRNGINHT